MKFTSTVRQVQDESTRQDKEIVTNQYQGERLGIVLTVTVKREEEERTAEFASLCEEAHEIIRNFEHPNQVEMTFDGLPRGASDSPATPPPEEQTEPAPGSADVEDAEQTEQQAAEV